ncbi:hypothetical protein MNBD_GAMMA08-1522 [hydrothermal vent metagenome]|uniref:CPXCG motif-containing cysteine-rich protein n=1 Tax=hydrothermal vent metagenome TaxID=652676 RepID=A0A3B0YH17_9ZZZZ
MREPLFSINVQCPYCGEQISVMIEETGEPQQYIEDCQVCCRPINFHIGVGDDQQARLRVFTDDEV